MANLKISQLTAAGTLTGTEEVPLVQSGSTLRTTAQDIANLAPPPPPAVLPFTLLSNSIQIATGVIINTTLKNTTSEPIINFSIGGASSEWLVITAASGIFVTNKTFVSSVVVLTNVGVLIGVPNRQNSTNVFIAFYDTAGAPVNLTTVSTTYRILTNIFIYT